MKMFKEFKARNTKGYIITRKNRSITTDRVRMLLHQDITY